MIELDSRLASFQPVLAASPSADGELRQRVRAQVIVGPGDGGETAAGRARR